MVLSNYINRKIPEYYDHMYLDGFTPTEVYIAFNKKIKK